MKSPELTLEVVSGRSARDRGTLHPSITVEGHHISWSERRIEGPAFGVVVPAGRSERMEGIDKAFATLAGRPLLAWTLAAFKRCDDIEQVVLVAPTDSLDRFSELVREWRFTRVRRVVAGGPTRQGSVRAGIEATVGAAILVVHDAARPLVGPDLISRGIALARESGAAICAVRARDTVKEVSGEPPHVTRTLDRDGLWLAQTPQCFERTLLLSAHARARSSATDDATLVEALGHEVVVYEGSTANLKVTTPQDLVLAEALLRARLSG